MRTAKFNGNLKHDNVTWEPVFGSNPGDHSGGTLQVWSMDMSEFMELRLRVSKGMQNQFHQDYISKGLRNMKQPNLLLMGRLIMQLGILNAVQVNRKGCLKKNDLQNDIARKQVKSELMQKIYMKEGGQPRECLETWNLLMKRVSQNDA